ncbi:tripartite tricarboxylate transporter TctB family protein [Aquabacterium sp. OR-4]|uniref:tripartite tricarboxylate transporter TctB family protein n=1 Tax=Aquabacterium sp. OR-4 TaxID=2978127 RepID=UPI0028CABC04|nr:tripartite tricarboxylate transporter TctB family protein [Aquabacterium sp. OR-4]MDT7835417.1 tripartite tricarboxylate transporter TctB family protein [Aquabacterium sp. OR-4]
MLALAALLAAGASQIGGDAGYGGVGPAFLAWAVSALLGGCGLLLLREALSGGFRGMPVDDEADDAADTAAPAPAYWPGFAWVSAGLLLNALLITRIGFILSCALCFALAVRGFKGAQGRGRHGAGAWLRDGLIGMAIAGPVFWMFSKGLAISLPGLTSTGWI